MSFVSLVFWLFLPLVFALHYACPRRQWQNVVLLAASYVFYGWWDYRFCALMLFSSLVDYAVGLAIYRSRNPKIRKALLATGVLVGLGVLGFSSTSTSLPTALLFFSPPSELTSTLRRSFSFCRRESASTPSRLSATRLMSIAESWSRPRMSVPTSPSSPSFPTWSPVPSSGRRICFRSSWTGDGFRSRTRGKAAGSSFGV